MKIRRWDYDIPIWLRIDVQMPLFKKTLFDRRGIRCDRKITIVRIINRFRELGFIDVEIKKMTGFSKCNFYNADKVKEKYKNG